MRRTRILFAFAAALVIAVAVATTAVGHWLYVGSDPAHIHVNVHWFLNEVDQSSNAQSNTREAQIEWHQDTSLDLSSTSSHDTARFHVVDGFYGNTGWAGLGDYCYHCGHLHSRLNLSYDNGDDRATTCQEIGHNIGEDHHPGDCMGAGYFADWNSGVGQHSIDEVNFVYSHIQ